jgi:tRNA nucleotidyltransferase/poly(A) polymerase
MKLFLYRPVNAYRGIQFASRMELQPDQRYYEVMREVISSGVVQKIHPRVVKQEWDKLVVKGKKPSIGFQIGRSTGLFHSEFPGFVEALDASNNWDNLLSMLDLVHERNILSSIHKDRHFIFIISLILYVLPEDARKDAGALFLNRIAVRGGFARIAYSLLEAIATLDLLVYDLVQMEKKSEQIKNPPSRKKLPGLRLSPGVPKAKEISAREQKEIRIQEFLKSIAPYTWDEFCIFCDFVRGEKSREIEYVEREM